MYSHSGRAFGMAKAVTTFLVTLVISYTRRLFFKFFLGRPRLDKKCDKK